MARPPQDNRRNDPLAEDIDDEEVDAEAEGDEAAEEEEEVWYRRPRFYLSVLGGMATLVIGVAIGIGVSFKFFPKQDVQDDAETLARNYPVERAARKPSNRRLPRVKIAPGVEDPPPLPLPEDEEQMARLRSGIGPAPEPRWQRFAAKVHIIPGLARVSVVIDDLGLSAKRTLQAIALPRAVTLSFLPYGQRLKGETALARERGHELLVHVPMEPRGNGNPGANPLVVGLSIAEIRKRLDWALTQFTGYVGINNHMGSRFTADRRAVAVVMDELRRRELLFLDSRTSGNTVAANIAREIKLPVASRQVFLDDEQKPDRNSVMGNLRLLEAIARREGTAVAIGHPHRVTLTVLKEWIPGLRARGIQLVPLSALIRERMAKDATP